MFKGGQGIKSEYAGHWGRGGSNQNSTKRITSRERERCVRVCRARRDGRKRERKRRRDRGRRKRERREKRKSIGS
jgi:hypothetical protein